MNKITVTIRDVYGKQMIYPVCDTAKVFAEIAGTKTLTSNALRAIKALGFNVVFQQPTINVSIGDNNEH